jgi:hypothetical protein
MVPTSAMATPDPNLLPPAVKVPNAEDAPIKQLSPVHLQMLGEKLSQLFTQYKSDRRLAELRWLRNERQYLGVYDPDIDKELTAGRSRSYPKVTRVKVISVLSRLMSLMFPGNERNWELKASPSANMDPKDVQEAIAAAQKRDADAGSPPAKLDLDYVYSAIKQLTNKRAEDLSTMIDGQLNELGGHQTLDYIALNRSVLKSGITFGVGLLEGPFVRETSETVWSQDAQGQPKPTKRTVSSPVFEWLRIWDFYPDMSAKNFEMADGYFTRKIMSRSQVRKLAERSDFFGDLIKKYLTEHTMGNWRPELFETELRAMGVKSNTNEMKTETSKFEILVWHGGISGQMLDLAGIEVPVDKQADDIDAEIWTIDSNVIKATLNPWKSLGVDVKMLHTFLFDEDDTSPVGQGLPTIMRDSQMSISAASRMLLDNASVICGPNLELNTDLLRPDQDLTSTTAYKFWYREGTGPDAAQPAVRNIEIDSHLDDLIKVIEFYQKIADQETFVGPATGGDMESGPSEPMRTAAGASMIRGDQGLPFKDIVRSFDSFTQSVLDSIVQFNRKLNSEQTPEADYDIIARGATSLVAKEIRGQQVDQLATTLTDEEKQEIDFRKFARARLKVRDLDDLLVTDEESDRRMEAKTVSSQQQAEQQQKLMEANIRKLLADAFKNIAQGQKNSAAADATAVQTALDLLERGLMGALSGGEGGSGEQAGAQNPALSANGGVSQPQAGASAGGGAAPDTSGGSQGGDGGVSAQ